MMVCEQMCCASFTLALRTTWWGDEFFGGRQFNGDFLQGRYHFYGWLNENGYEAEGGELPREVSEKKSSIVSMRHEAFSPPATRVEWALGRNIVSEHRVSLLELVVTLK